MAIIFSAEPPEGLPFRGMDLRRTPIKGKIAGLITCKDPVGTYTHYWGGRTVAHDNESCPACEAGIGKRWHVYVSLFNCSEQAYFLFESTAFAAVPILTMWRRYGDLTGINLVAERRSEKKNAKVLIKLNENSRGQYALPKPIDIPKILAHIWRTPASELPPIENPRYDAERWNHLTGNGHGSEHRPLD